MKKRPNEFSWLSKIVAHEVGLKCRCTDSHGCVCDSNKARLGADAGYK